MPSLARMLALAAALLCSLCVLQAVGAGQHPSAPALAVPAPEDRVDINHATIDQLMKIPGMTHTWAGRIVRFRPYRTKLDLLQQGVVTSAVYNRIKDYVIAHRNQQ